jgi:hypothetical protein
VELLRDLVILTARLAGRRWLEANPDSVAVFTAFFGAGGGQAVDMAGQRVVA